MQLCTVFSLLLNGSISATEPPKSTLSIIRSDRRIKQLRLNIYFLKNRIELSRRRDVRSELIRKSLTFHFCSEMFTECVWNDTSSRAHSTSLKVELQTELLKNRSDSPSAAEVPLEFGYARCCWCAPSTFTHTFQMTPRTVFQFSADEVNIHKITRLYIKARESAASLKNPALF